MRNKLLILFLFIGSLAIGQNSPIFDTIKFKRGGKLYKLTITPTSLTLNNVTYTMTGVWIRNSSGFLYPSNKTDNIKYPGIKYMGSSFNHPTANCLVWWNHYDSTLCTTDPDPAKFGPIPVLYLGSDTNSWRITTVNNRLMFQYKTNNGWMDATGVDQTGIISHDHL